MENFNNTGGVSIIIPTKNNGGTLEELLKSISSDNSKKIEVIVVDTNSNDDTREICKKYNVKIIKSDYGRSKSRNMGAIHANYENLLFLDSDMEVSVEVLQSCSNLHEYDAVIFKEITVGNNIIAKIRKYERVGLFGTIYPEAPRCIKKKVFINLGGYNETMEGFEDLDLHSRLIRNNSHIKWEDAIIYHHEENISLAKYLKKRKFYSEYLNNFKRLNPTYYAKLISLRTRINGLHRSAKSYNIIYSIILMPMVISLRVLEIIYSQPIKNKHIEDFGSTPPDF